MIFKKIITIAYAVLMLSQLPVVGMEVAVYDQPESRFCRYENGEWLFCGRNREWWDLNHPGIWEKYGVRTRWNDVEPFADISEQDWTSGFERGIYRPSR